MDYRWPSIILLGVKIHILTQEDLLDEVVRTAQAKRRATIAYVNINVLNIAYQNPAFRDLLNQFDLVYCDGVGIQLGAWIAGTTIPYRYTLPDWLSTLAQLGGGHDLSLFLLGGRPTVADKAARRLQEEYPDLKVAGTHHGYFEKSRHSPVNGSVIQAIQDAEPDILLVGFGTPLQETWLQENEGQLPVHIALMAGAALDYVSGTTYRAPAWITDHGLEWLARLATEPARLWQRYLVGIPVFIWRCLKQRLAGLSAVFGERLSSG